MPAAALVTVQDMIGAPVANLHNAGIGILYTVLMSKVSQIRRNHKRKNARYHNIFIVAKAFHGKGLPLINVHNLSQHIQRVIPFTLERVAADDRAVTAAVVDVARVLINGICTLC